MRAKSVHAVLAAGDYERAKTWYAERLGLKPAEENMGAALYDINGTQLVLYPSQFAGTNKATAAEFRVDDVERTVAELRESGVTFEDYDLPGLKTEKGIATLENEGKTFKAAWFKDSEGNVLALTGA
ncbi:MAG: VOC family protein [Actinomycetota bacterium]